MVICAKCGFKNQDNSKFCNECGASLIKAFGVCSKCNIIYKNGEKFCSQCGEKLLFEESVSSLLKMIPIPGRNYSVLQTPVTQALYRKVMGVNPAFYQAANKEFVESSIITAQNVNSEKRPVEQVSWFDSIVFCNKLSNMMNRKPCYSMNNISNTTEWGNIPLADEPDAWINLECDFYANGYRLATNEEWLFAAKAEKPYKYAGSDNIDEVAWYLKNGLRQTHDVGLLKPNDYGLYDMNGNVWEWCWDLYEEPDGNTLKRVLRGGSFIFDQDMCNVETRYWCYPAGHYRGIGLRIVCTNNE